MYYLYKKSKKVQLPEFHYRFKGFDEFYELTTYVRVTIFGAYYINIVTDDYNGIVNFIDSSDSYKDMFIYIEVNESLLKYIQLAKPGVSLLSGQSNYEMFKDLISKHGILFDKNVVDKMYYAIGHSYEEMEEALILLKDTYPTEKTITLDHISRLFVVDTLTYPRSVLIMYLRLDRGRERNLEKSIEYFGNDIVLYSMRKTLRKFLKEKVAYIKSGNGSYLIKTIPITNMINMLRALDYERMGFMEIKTIMEFYEKGVTIYDFVHGESNSCYDAEFDPFG